LVRRVVPMIGLTTSEQCPQMRDTIRVVFLVKGDGHLEPLKPCRISEGVDDIHLLLSNAALSSRFIFLGAPKIMRQ
jgi:hypothetical protein